MEKRICFYHTDGDGFCSGAIVARYFNWDIELRKYNYGNDFPWEIIDENTEVYMVDVSLDSVEQMFELKDRCLKLVWIDHENIVDEYWEHYRKTQQKIEGPRPRELNSFAACELTWYRLFGGEDMPKAVRLLGRYDIWDHCNPEVLEFQYGFRGMEDRDPASVGGREFWESLFTKSMFFRRIVEDEILSRGRSIWDYIITQNKSAAKFSFMTNIDDYPVLACNAGGVNSYFFDSVLSEYPDACAVMLFYFKGNHWIVNMFEIAGRKCPNLGEIAKKYGGGGRSVAAGFTWKKWKLPFYVPINNS